MLSRLLTVAVITTGFAMLPLAGCADHDHHDDHARFDDHADYDHYDHANADRDDRRSDVHVDNDDRH